MLSETIIYDIVQYQGELFKTKGYASLPSDTRGRMSYSYSSHQRSDSTHVELELHPHILKFVPIDSLDKNLTQELKIQNLKKYIRRIRLHKLLRTYLMHWACKPGGPLYNLSLKHFATCSSTSS